MGRMTSGLVVVALLGWSFAGIAWADETAGSDELRAMVREEIEAYRKAQKSDFRVYWNNGLNMSSGDGNFKLNIGGLIQADFVFYDDYDKNLETAVGGEWHSGFEFRRARIHMAGTLYKYVSFKAQYDFAGGDVDFEDVWVGVSGQDCLGCMVPDFKVGHFKEYFGLEALTSNEHITFLERALPVLAFTPARHSGLGLTRDLFGERVTVAAGVFGNSDEDGTFDWTNGYNLTGRMTFLPWAPCNCPSRFWEIGAAYSYKGDVRNLRYRTRPDGTHLGPRIVDTGSFEADSAQLIGFESAFQYDRWHAQGEYIMSVVDSAVAGDPIYAGWYVEASYMLLGGTRPFNRKTAEFGRVIPCTNLWGRGCRGFGGLEIAARYSTVDLDDGNVEGGVVADSTVGLNWYLNPNMVVKLNYTHVDVENANGAGSPAGDGTQNIFGTRFQIDF